MTDLNRIGFGIIIGALLTMIVTKIILLCITEDVDISLGMIPVVLFGGILYEWGYKEK